MRVNAKSWNECERIAENAKIRAELPEKQETAELKPEECLKWKS